MRLLKSRLALLICGSLTFAGAVRAEGATEFYRDHPITILVGSGVAGGYDTYSRTLARFWGEHIPGHPKIVVENMPGANGVTMMNYLVATAPKDGTVVGSPFAANITAPIFDRDKYTRYDPRTLNWIGNIAPQYNACFVRKDSAVKSLDDAMRTETHISASGANSNSSVMAGVYNALLGTKFKVVMGYSSSEMILAIERKEVDGTCVSYDSLLASFPEMIDRDQIKWLILLNDRPVPELPGTPPATQFAHTEQAREIIELLMARNLQGRPYVVAPSAPQDRVAVLRASFMETMADPGFLAEAKKLRMAVEPSDHVAMERMIADVYKIPADVVDATMALTKGN